jgi:hypothetical protein
MTSPYISSISNIRARTLGPLNARRTPNITRIVNRGIVNGTPPQFFSQQEPLNANMNSISRNQHIRTQYDKDVKQVYKDTSSSDRIRRLKSQTIGSNMKSNSTKNVNQNDTRSAVRRMRSSGYVVPRKKRI